MVGGLWDVGGPKSLQLTCVISLHIQDGNEMLVADCMITLKYFKISSSHFVT